MEDGWSQIISGLIVFGIMVLLNALLNAFAAAVRTISEGDIEKRGNTGKSTKLLQFKSEPEDLSNTITVTEILSAVIIGGLIVYCIREGPFSGLHIAVTIAAVLLVPAIYCVLGIFFPKILGAHYQCGTAFNLAGFAGIMNLICRPFVFVVSGLAWLAAKPFGADRDSIQEDVTEEEIISMVNEGQEQGVFDANEAEMINNIVEFGDKEARDIMTHRKNIIAVDGEMNLKEAAAYMLNATISRFPVYEEDVDTITGIIHLKDAMKSHATGEYDDWMVKDIPGLIRSVEFIPETRKINLLFERMQSAKLHMVIVLDEYGQTAGLVALEDILEEIVGNIEDEYDEELKLIEELPDGSFIVSGMTPLAELEEFFCIEFDLEEDIETLNGYLVSKLDKIPDEDEDSAIEDLGYCFHILSVANKTIEKVHLTKMGAGAAAE